jgi:hypothetical protein
MVRAGRIVDADHRQVLRDLQSCRRRRSVHIQREVVTRLQRWPSGARRWPACSAAAAALHRQGASPRAGSRARAARDRPGRRRPPRIPSTGPRRWRSSRRRRQTRAGCGPDGSGAQPPAGRSPCCPCRSRSRPSRRTAHPPQSPPGCATRDPSQSLTAPSSRIGAACPAAPAAGSRTGTPGTRSACPRRTAAAPGPPRARWRADARPRGSARGTRRPATTRHGTPARTAGRGPWSNAWRSPRARTSHAPARERALRWPPAPAWRGAPSPGRRPSRRKSPSCSGAGSRGQTARDRSPLAPLP